MHESAHIKVMRDVMRGISHAEGKRLRASSMKALFPNELSNEGGLKAQLHLRSPGQSAAMPWVFDCVLAGQTFAPCKGRAHWMVNNNR